MAKGKKNSGLAGTAKAATPYVQTAKEGGLMLLAAIAAGGAGAALGRHSFLAGIPVTLIGVHKGNKYVIAAGLGLVLSNGFQKQASAATTETSTESVEGFDIKQIASEAKDRVGTFFKNFGEKLYLSKQTIAGLSGDDDNVTYFVNPYSNKELDMSAIDRVQEQIAQMNGVGLSEIEREF
ncbi:MAG TPA: hypothetical protein PK325_01045 [Cyclobacteriaceae bacterium]|nr:hypothetical protein [Cyclobacteriaceae bacterium]HMV08144.1 hypothetical protein [Cyclobacteriaceae bacterium]HMV88358.1 hypothetical protein [Cyclobacteriaceae bacterium]HMX00785.1 hypothetical protein [Cyclobacteriaceae bacterium]HMX49340.1 hypothetical protein [Cyclobacteriaceae bacterium]